MQIIDQNEQGEDIFNTAVLLLSFGADVNDEHKRALKLVYDDNPYLSFHELLIKDKSVL